MQKNRNSARAARTIQVTPSSNVSPEDDGIDEVEEIALTEVVSEAPIERLVPDENEARPEATKKENPIKAHPSKKIRRVISIWEKVPEDAEIEADETYLASKEEIQAARTCAGRTLSISPETGMMVYDILFFSTYAIGWIITLAFNYDAITDNAVTRVTKKYNICIGVDSYPARYFSIPMSYCFTIAFCLTGVLFMKRMLDQREWSKRCSKVWRTGLVCLAMLLNLFFAWTIGVMPENAETFRMHLMGFILALAGYALLKLVSIIEFGYFADADDGEPGLSCKDMCHTWRKFVFLTFEGTCCLILSFSCCYLSVKYYNILYSWPIEKVESILNTTVPTDTQLDYNTMPVLFVTVVCPIVAKIIDPHRRHITITFKYQHPDELADGDIEGDSGRCQDKCLDTPIPCNCCWAGK